MALINCPECGNQISSMARLCPACGFPISDSPAPPAAPKPVKQKSVKTTKKLPNGYGSVYRLPGNRRKPWCAAVTNGWETNGDTSKFKAKACTYWLFCR